MRSVTHSSPRNATKEPPDPPSRELRYLRVCTHACLRERQVHMCECAQVHVRTQVHAGIGEQVYKCAHVSIHGCVARAYVRALFPHPWRHDSAAAHQPESLHTIVGHESLEQLISLHHWRHDSAAAHQPGSLHMTVGHKSLEQFTSQRPWRHDSAAAHQQLRGVDVPLGCQARLPRSCSNSVHKPVRAVHSL